MCAVLFLHNTTVGGNMANKKVIIVFLSLILIKDSAITILAFYADCQLKSALVCRCVSLA